MFSKILIANRGEIAVRIIRACKEMGIATVAVFSEADRDALHVSLADESVCIGPAKVQDSYLNMPAILSAAVKTGAQAIHPGYGLLSENAKFAELCEECHIQFIGPNAKLIAELGDKDEAKRTMRTAGVPVVPGSGLIQSDKEALTEARKIGFPLLVKARAGGGGRGIRLVNGEEELLPALHASSQEAASAFGDGACYLEKYLDPVKHIEMQILCDNYDNVLCLGERECSIQRKHQKLLEESPAVCVTSQLREKMMAAATKAAKAVHYRSLGTIEFLVDNDLNFYFMEMNTRLQVEHPVTEMVTGMDLVKWQIRVASGTKLPFVQDDVRLRGHAIECRINAEDPDNGFTPSCGKISLLHIPGGPWVRFDTALYQDYTVPPFYDSLLGKLIVHAQTREEAIRKMQAALAELVIEGVSHTAGLQMDILADPSFCDGTYHTDFMEKREKLC
ncbi:MAG: acetyl-CoA carboxylase biotin carboxylase subunit [Oscillospiraceae bacterium]|nr:acetyl-CoA carboxylase biotin carboxylase subunit [Oscillospiraceae bacterium]MDD3261342.1 acetyl-CoA carboxylase biotin carboxylase subunit [Oscillospiraceae bacterium]